MGVTRQIANEIVEAKFQEIPGPAVERTRRAILDDVGIGFLGYSVAGQPLVEYAKDVGGGRPEATLIGDGTRVSCVAAAAVNAQMACDTNFNETGPGHHELSSLAQTAISVGERVGASGKDVITAVALSYEMNGRFTRAALPAEIIGGYGSKRHIVLSVTIAAAKLLGLDETQINHAIGIAWYYSPPPQEFIYHHSWWKRIASFHLGTCQLGVQSALLAQKGFEGPSDLLEKETFYDLERLMWSPSPYHYPANELLLKPWISPRGTQPGLQAALEIVAEQEIGPEEIDEIIFTGKSLYFDFPFNNPAPVEYWDAIYSVQWQFAMALLGYEAGAAWTTEERLRDPACIALARKVKLQEDSYTSEVWDSGQTVADDYPNEVEILAGGRRYKKRKTYRENLGSPGAPLSPEQLEGKFRTQAVPVIGEGRCEELLGMLSRLEEQRDIRELTRLFGAA